MAGLADLRVPTVSVPVPGTETVLVLRGLSVMDLSHLVKVHGEALDRVYGDLSGAVEEDSDVSSVAKHLLQTAPAAVAEIISLASDEPGLEAAAARLPLPVQLDALMGVFRLTFESEEALGKFLETLISASEGFTRVINTMGTG